ncbi:YfhO family protein [Alkalicoccobacillus porphyridii]|uniref:YfhO family protein n=1 Tax=Alkalicoccobacillus porphyridii TaxID=2597270 RepID=A0A553ZT98_9BACI|nr:YfhO family protein [Alkalicoccobacillus porphyridii]TSB44691.1 YfhO family protein [Alkalicoccobacillus porphyridii]
MNRNQMFWLILVVSLVFALLAHLFFLKELLNGRYMVGPNDGLSQMLPFKHFLYQQYTDGHWFYSHDFGLGSGTFAQLAYYFSTNMVFLVTVFFVWLLESISIIGSPDLLFWAQSTVLASVFRMSIILIISTYVFRYFKLGWAASFTGAMIYASSVMYYRHTAFWEFFADAYLWIPLLVLGIEKIIREKQPVWLIVGLSLALINNFYFAYMSCLFVAIYVVGRWFIRFSEDRATILEQMKLYVPAILLSFAIGAVSFIPAVYGFLNNYRPPFEDPIELLDLRDNILFTSRTLIVPALFLLFIFTFSLYKHRVFRFFAFLSVVFMVFHYIPIVASVFNGFSAPQNRFEYMGSFLIAGACAYAIGNLRSLSKRQMLWSSLITTLLFISVFVIDRALELSLPEFVEFAILLPLMLGGFLWIALKRPSYSAALLCFCVGATQLFLAYQYQDRHLSQAGNLTETTKEYIEETYQPPEQKDLIQSVLEEDEHPMPRLEWVVGGRSGRNNTGMVQDFSSISAYSSVLNQELLFFYYNDLQIDMKRESVSRYSGFGDRANLYSLLGGHYILFPKDEEIHAPYGFEAIKSNDEYVVYQNQHTLPFAGVTSTVYSEEQLDELPMVTREHAMLSGVILEQPEAPSPAPEADRDLMSNVEIEAVGGTYEDGVLTITDERGGLDLHVSEEDATGDGDFYLSFYLLNQSETARLFRLDVNDYVTDRKSRESIYRTGVNDLTIRIPKEETISIRMREGSYQIDDFLLHEEDYQQLEQAVDERSQQEVLTSIDEGKMSFTVPDASASDFLTIPVPFEKGWSVKVNGVSQSIEKANYAFMAVALEEGTNEVEFSYLPPYFKESLVASIAGLMMSTAWIVLRRKKQT